MNIQNQQQWNETFFEACQKGRLEEIRHLCQKQYLDKGWADIHADHDSGFRWACGKGHLEVVKYLLTSTELKEAGHTWAKWDALNEHGFRWSCANGHLDIVKYLLSSNEWIEHTMQNQGFHLACANEHWEGVRWLVLDYEIKKTPGIEEIIQDYPQAQEYFRAREERQAIQRVLQNHKPGNSDHSNEREDERSVKKSKKL